MQHLQVVNVVVLIKPVEIGHHIWKAVAEAINYSATLILNVYTVDGLPNNGIYQHPCCTDSMVAESFLTISIATGRFSKAFPRDRTLRGTEHSSFQGPRT